MKKYKRSYSRLEMKRVPVYNRVSHTNFYRHTSSTMNQNTYLSFIILTIKQQLVKKLFFVYLSLKRKRYKNISIYTRKYRKIIMYVVKKLKLNQ